MNRSLRLPKPEGWTKLPHGPFGGGIERPIINICLNWQGIYTRNVQIPSMKKAWTIALAAFIVVALIIVLYVMSGLFMVKPGFDEGDLSSPYIDDLYRDQELPGTLGSIDYPYSIQKGVSYYPTVYEGYGGIIELVVENEGANDVYIASYSAHWEGSSDLYTVNCSTVVGSGEELWMGPLHFVGPGTTGSFVLMVTMDLWSSSGNGLRWSDWGEISVTSIDLNVIEEASLVDWDVELNPTDYYNKVNRLVDFVVVDGIVDQVRTEAPGDYSLLQIIRSYQWVRDNIEYLAETGDYWQSPTETLELGTGDCEDHSILLASIITALGGNCRVNLIATHAFASVYIGNSSTMAEAVVELQDYYGTDIPIHWTEDELGCWLVVDTNGLPYPGGLPAACSPCDPDGGLEWVFDDGDWIDMVDVTGDTIIDLLP